jgi:hypothetical protein
MIIGQEKHGGIAMTNNLWRIGDSADHARDATSLPEAQSFGRGMGDMSHTTRNLIIAFSREHIGFKPSYEKAWFPGELPKPKRKALWRVIFQV